MQMALQKAATREVTVDRLDLIEKLKENRKKHIEAYDQACKTYKTRLLEQIEGQAAKATKRLSVAIENTVREAENLKDDEFMDESITIINTVQFRLPVPVSYAAAYDTQIMMFQWEKKDEVELSGAEFSCFVEDKWDWQEHFFSNTLSYCAN